MIEREALSREREEIAVRVGSRPSATKREASYWRLEQETGSGVWARAIAGMAVRTAAMSALRLNRDMGRSEVLIVF